MIIPVKTSIGSYDIVIEEGCIKKAKQYINLNRRVLVVTDSGVPKEYANLIKKQAKEGYIYTFPEGENSKTIDVYLDICKTMLEHNFTRSDAIVAVGGGVVGDMAGFAAASYMRGIDFINIPTTLLSQVDSSIGGKVAVDFMGVKNILGAFYPPKSVLIDRSVLDSLEKRQLACGMAEAIKMAVTFDPELLSLIEKSEPYENLEDIIIGSLLIKKMVVEEDEKETGMRKVLNFGHTIGHGIESERMGNLFHGECVSIGMIPMCEDEVKNRLIPILEKYNLPTSFVGDKDKVCAAILHDKKTTASNIMVIKCKKVGTYEMEKMTQLDFISFVKEELK